MSLRWTQPSIYTSLTTAILAFGIDRAHKAFQVSADCISLGAAPCVEVFTSYTPFALTGGWRGGEIFPVTGFFDYVLVWNTGISYGLLDGMPVWTLGLVMLAAIVALSIWWVRADSALIRLGLAERIRHKLDHALSLPAAGQGAVGIECRLADDRIRALLAPLHHEPTALCVRAERAMNAALQGGCQVPIAAFAVLAGEQLQLRGRVGDVDGSQLLRAEASATAAAPEALGQQVAAQLLAQGAGEILRRVYGS